MFVEYKTKVKISDVGKDYKITNKALLAYLEEVACEHSNIAGYGMLDIPKTGKTWIILNWKVEIYNRPMYTDEIILKTWSRAYDRIYSYRDFEIYDINNKIIGVASTRWALLDVNVNKIAKITSDLVKSYTIEEKSVFTNYEFEKNVCIEDLEYVKDCVVTRNMIDMNNHVHNIYYLDIANEGIPYEIYNKGEYNKFEVLYKRQLKLGDNIKLFYKNIDNEYYIVIKSHDEKILHSVIKVEV